MKKIMNVAFVFMAVVLFSVNGNAQFKYGGRVGLNVANMAGDYTDGQEPSMLLSFHVGAVGQYEFSEKFFVSPEINYSAKGFTQEYESRGSILGIETNTKFDLTARLNYIEVPVHVGVKLTDSFVLKVGPYFGFLAGVKQEGTTEVEVAGVVTKTDFSSTSDAGINSTDFGLNMGVQVQLPNGFGVEGRYGLGLSNTASEGNDAFQNRVLSFGITYLLGGE